MPHPLCDQLSLESFLHEMLLSYQSAKVFSLESFPLYGIIIVGVGWFGELYVFAQVNEENRDSLVTEISDFLSQNLSKKTSDSKI